MVGAFKPAFARYEAFPKLHAYGLAAMGDFAVPEAAGSANSSAFANARLG